MEVVKDVPMVFGQFGCDDGERKIAVEARSSGKVRGARPPPSRWILKKLHLKFVGGTLSWLSVVFAFAKQLK
jgi:hypothetical protein